jgi:hypothetical protein
MTTLIQKVHRHHRKLKSALEKGSKKAMKVWSKNLQKLELVNQRRIQMASRKTKK